MLELNVSGYLDVAVAEKEESRHQGDGHCELAGRHRRRPEPGLELSGELWRGLPFHFQPAASSCGRHQLLNRRGVEGHVWLRSENISMREKQCFDH